MKKIFTLLVSAIVTVTAFADNPFSEINLTKLDNKRYIVEVDGRKFTPDNETIAIRDLQPGYHNVRIYSVKKGGYPLFGVLGGFAKRDLIYDNPIMLKPWYQVNISIKRAKVFVEEKRLNRSRSRNHDRNTDDRWNDRQDDYGNYDRNDRPVVHRPISEVNFTDLKAFLSHQSFDNDRLTAAKQQIGDSYFTVAQVAELMRLFSFENNKLELAKFCYDRTVDRDRYLKLCDQLSFSRSRQELSDFVGNR